MRSTNVTSVIGIALLFLVISGAVEAQVFPAGGLPMEFNGGFAGESGKQRLVSSSHIHVSRYEKLSTRLSQTFSYDAFIPSLRSGIGATAGYQSIHYKPTDSLSWELRNPYFTVAVSPKISFGGKLTLAPFVDFRFVHSTSPSYYHPNRVDPPVTSTNSRYTIRLGFLLNSAKGYVGLTVVPFSKTMVSQYNYSYRFATFYYPGEDGTKLILQAGRTFQKKTVDPKFSFTPQVALSIYKEPQYSGYRHFLGLVDLNLAFRFNRFHTGVGAGGFQFAYDFDKLRIGTALVYYRPYRKHGYQTFVNGQFTTVKPFEYMQFISVRYLVE